MPLLAPLLATQVLVMSYTTFRMHKEAVGKKGVDIVVCDEVGCGLGRHGA